MSEGGVWNTARATRGHDVCVCARLREREHDEHEHRREDVEVVVPAAALNRSHDGKRWELAPLLTPEEGGEAEAAGLLVLEIWAAVVRHELPHVGHLWKAIVK